MVNDFICYKILKGEGLLIDCVELMTTAIIYMICTIYFLVNKAVNFKQSHKIKMIWRFSYVKNLPFLILLQNGFINYYEISQMILIKSLTRK